MISIFFKYRPAIRIALLATLGFIIGGFIETDVLKYVFFLASIFCIIVLTFKCQNTTFYLASILIGMGISCLLFPNQIEYPGGILPDIPAEIEGEIASTVRQDSVVGVYRFSGTINSSTLGRVDDVRLILRVYNPGQSENLIGTGSSVRGQVKLRVPRPKNIITDFPEVTYLRSEDAHFFAMSDLRRIAVTANSGSMETFRESIVGGINKRIAVLYGVETGGIVRALITGDKNMIPFEVRSDYSFSGTAHVLAVSGLHVGIIASILYFLLGFIRNKWLKFALFTVILLFYVFITGFQPSAIRAAIIYLFSMYIYYYQRKVDMLNIMAFSVLFIVVTDPQLIYSISFQLSVSAVLGIVLFYKRIYNLITHLIKSNFWLKNAIIVSLSMTFSSSILVAPFVSYYFGIYSIISPLANMVVVPATSLAIVYSIAALVFYPIFGISKLFSSSAELLIVCSNWINKVAVSLPYSYLYSELAFPISIVIALLLIYVIYSKVGKQLLFRLTVSLLTLFMSIILIFNYQNKCEIIPRENFVAIEVPLNNNKTFIGIADRCFADFSRSDYQFNRYLLNRKDSLILAYDGPSGLKIVKSIKKTNGTKFIEFNNDIKRSVESNITNRKKLPQINY